MKNEELDLMLAEALTRIGKNVDSLKSRFACLPTWEQNTIRNHTLIATYGPSSIANTLYHVVEHHESTGNLMPSYIRAIAAMFQRMHRRGDSGDRPIKVPTCIPHDTLVSYCKHLDKYGVTVCRYEYFERFGRDGIREALADLDHEVVVTVSHSDFEPATIVNYNSGGSGYLRIAAAQPTVMLIEVGRKR